MSPLHIVLLLCGLALGVQSQLRDGSLAPSPSPSPSSSPATDNATRNGTLAGALQAMSASPSPSPAPTPDVSIAGNRTAGLLGNFTIDTAGENTGNNTTSASTSTLEPTVNATAISTNDSSLSVFPFINGQLVVLGPCTALAIHTHDYAEYAIADPNNRLPIKMVYVNQRGEAVTAEVLPGDTFVIPAGLMHYQINYGCSSVTFLGVFPRPASTQLVLPSLTAMPDLLVFLKLTGINATDAGGGNGTDAAGNRTSAMGFGFDASTADRLGASMNDTSDVVANVTSAATDRIPFVINPVCAQTCT